MRAMYLFDISACLLRKFKVTNRKYRPKLFSISNKEVKTDFFY